MFFNIEKKVMLVFTFVKASKILVALIHNYPQILDQFEIVGEDLNTVAYCGKYGKHK
jgi:hypothetical protein